MINMNGMKKSIRRAVFCIALLIAAQTTASAQTVEHNYDFHRGTLGWTAGFADYPPNIGTGYELESRLRFIPRKLTRLPRQGFYIQGHNRSGDLFMFLKRRLSNADGIVANRTYRVEFVMTLASNAASGCVGIGGAPGESVYLKAGASPIEPLAVLQANGYLRMNVNVGNQSQGGAAASVAGNIANPVRFWMTSTDTRCGSNSSVNSLTSSAPAWAKTLR